MINNKIFLEAFGKTCEDLKLDFYDTYDLYKLYTKSPKTQGLSIERQIDNEDVIANSFRWDKTKEGEKFWLDFSARYSINVNEIERNETTP